MRTPEVWNKDTPNEYLQFLLSGSAKDRRKQVREIYRIYADKRIVRSGPVVLGGYNGKYVPMEEANSCQSIIRVYTKEDQ